MYFGSVRFFKHLILTVTALLIIVPTVLCILLAVDNGKKSDEIDRLNSQLSAQSQVLQTSDDQSRTSSATESSDNVKAEPSVTESAKPETSAVPETSATVPETTKAPETTPASSSAVESYSSVSSGADSYTSLFPTLYADKYDGEYENSENTVYLTFDDGPSVLTENLLYYLRQENVKATFFVVPERTEYCYSLLREISNAGHTIGIHSASHDYEKIYASVDAFLEDFNEAYEIVLEATGKAPDIYRFPGGSVNDYNEKTRDDIIAEMDRRGFTYFDWNVDSNDAGGAKKAQTVFNNVTAGVSQNRVSVVLQHDIHDFSVDAVEDIIVWGLNNGYSFERLTENSPGVHHGVLN